MSGIIDIVQIIIDFLKGYEITIDLFGAPFSLTLWSLLMSALIVSVLGSLFFKLLFSVFVG